MTELTHPKLIALKEYMTAKIDETLPGKFTYKSIPHPDWTAEKIIKHFKQTGQLIMASNSYDTKFTPISFDKFYNSKMNKKPCGV